MSFIAKLVKAHSSTHYQPLASVHVLCSSYIHHAILLSCQLYRYCGWHFQPRVLSGMRLCLWRRYPVLKKTPPPMNVFIVDLWRGSRHDLIRIHRAHPERPGCLILSRLRGCYTEAWYNEQCTGGIYKMTCFQAIACSRSGGLLLKGNLHNWADKSCY